MSPGAQARLARRLASAHLGEAGALAPLAATAGAPLVHALRKVGSAYADLATAAAGGSRTAFSAGRQDVDAAESRLAYVVGSVSRRIEPEPAPPLPRVASAPASSPSSLVLLLAIASLAAAIALVHGPRARDRREVAREGYAWPAPARQSRLRSAPRPGRPTRPGRAPLAAPGHRRPFRPSPQRPTPTPQSPRPASEQAEPLKAAAPRGKSLKRAAATPHAEAPARHHDASARRAKPSDPSPTTPSATPAPVRQKTLTEPAAPAAAAPTAPRRKPPVKPTALPSKAQPATPVRRPAQPHAHPPVPARSAQLAGSPVAPSSVKPGAASIGQNVNGGAGPRHRGTSSLRHGLDVRDRLARRPPRRGVPRHGRTTGRRPPRVRSVVAGAMAAVDSTLAGARDRGGAARAGGAAGRRGLDSDQAYSARVVPAAVRLD